MISFISFFIPHQGGFSDLLFFTSELKAEANVVCFIYVLQEQINEWANMTGFLCALGGVCLQKKSPTKPPTSAVDSRKVSVLPPPAQEVQYCPVTQLVFHFNSLLCLFKPTREG